MPPVTQSTYRPVGMLIIRQTGPGVNGPQNMVESTKVDLLHIDEALLVVDKPAGLSVLPDGWEKDSEYLVKMLEEKYGKIFIVHRLDKITSGVMVFARDAETHRVLNIQFENHEAQKTYHTIVEGNPKWEEKVARHPLRAN